jgi:hypothetical protein
LKASRYSIRREQTPDNVESPTAIGANDANTWNRLKRRR